MSNAFLNRDPAAELRALLDLMEKLRAPDGCPWDREQTHATIAPYTIEEAYEVEDAVARGDEAGLREELGDLLFQTIFQAQIAKEEARFDFADIAHEITQKMIRRHPHVFEHAEHRTSDEQTNAWEVQKAQERAARGKGGILDDVPLGLPALTRSAKIQKRAASVGFDWNSFDGILSKLDEEVGELREAHRGGDLDKIEDELGDVLSCVANIARFLKIDPETALRRSNRKFTRRFSYIEQTLTEQNRSLEDASLDEMEALWAEAKMLEREKDGG